MRGHSLRHGSDQQYDRHQGRRWLAQLAECLGDGLCRSREKGSDGRGAKLRHCFNARDSGAGDCNCCYQSGNGGGPDMISNALSLMILLPLLGAIVSFFVGTKAKFVALIASLAPLVLSLQMYME